MRPRDGGQQVIGALAEATTLRRSTGSGFRMDGQDYSNLRFAYMVAKGETKKSILGRFFKWLTFLNTVRTERFREILDLQGQVPRLAA
jgi:hypothetical protein